MGCFGGEIQLATSLKEMKAGINRYQGNNIWKTPNKVKRNSRNSSPFHNISTHSVSLAGQDSPVILWRKDPESKLWAPFPGLWHPNPMCLSFHDDLCLCLLFTYLMDLHPTFCDKKNQLKAAYKFVKKQNPSIVKIYILHFQTLATSKQFIVPPKSFCFQRGHNEKNLFACNY